MHRVHMGSSSGRALQIVLPKKEGVLEYALAADGSWKEYLGDKIFVPVLEVVGPDKESIALHIQDMRDRLGFRSSHNIRLHHCRWFGPQKLRIALTASSKDFRMGRTEIADTLLNIFNDNLYATDWVDSSSSLTAEAEE